jgi:protease IV
MRTLILALTCASFVGCRGFTVSTRNVVQMEGPVETRVELPPRLDAGPVQPFTVPSGHTAGGGSVVILDVDGVLLNTDYTGMMTAGENPVSLFREKLDTIATDACVKAVVLRINSPGGGVAAVELMRRDLVRFRQKTGIPMVACLMDVGAGGAYYLATAADRIVATPGTVTGGVGIILNLYNLRDLMGQFNIVPQEVKAGPFVDLGTPSRALSVEGKKILQDMADEYHQHIRTEIQQARSGINLADGTTLDGRVFTAGQAQTRGLVDVIGDLDQAIELARQAAGAPGAAAILYHRKNDPARTVYASTPNTPIQATFLPSIPGLDRSRLPTFLCMWQPEMAMEKLSGK